MFTAKRHDLMMCSLILGLLCGLPLASLGEQFEAASQNAVASSFHKGVNIHKQAFSALSRVARRAGLEIDTDLLVSVKDEITAAGVSILPDRESDAVLLVMVAGDSMRRASFYTVSAFTDVDGAPLMEVFDLRGRLVEDTLVSTAVSQLISLGAEATSGGTFDNVCKIQGGTPDQVCTSCYIFFSCCENICIR